MEADVAARRTGRPPCGPLSGRGGLDQGAGARSEGCGSGSGWSWAVRPAGCNVLEWRRGERAHQHDFQNFGADSIGGGGVSFPAMRKTERIRLVGKIRIQLCTDTVLSLSYT